MSDTYNRVQKAKIANVRVLNKNNASDKRILDKLAKVTSIKKKPCGGCSRKRKTDG